MAKEFIKDFNFDMNEVGQEVKEIRDLMIDAYNHDPGCQAEQMQREADAELRQALEGNDPDILRSFRKRKGLS